MESTHAAVQSPAQRPPGRLVSLDAFRGAIMIFLLSAGFGFREVARKHPDSEFWQFLSYNTDHAIWLGGGAWDMIQPAFMFMVGVAMPFSYGRRREEGQGLGPQFRHVMWRTFVLLLIALLIVTKAGESRTNFIFTNVLAQIALGYPFLFLLSRTSERAQWITIGVLAVGTWAVFAAHPAPPADFDYASVGVRPAIAGAVTLPGFFSHWNMGTNGGADFDRWFLNLFPRDKPFEYNPGGYVTLNFVPSLITMTLGLMAGSRLRGNAAAASKLRWLLAAALACLLAGLLAGGTVCPIVKRIWTPSWALYSGGIVLLLLAGFHYVIDMRGWNRWSYPFVIVGVNAIAAYLMDMFFREWVMEKLRSHLGFAVKGDFAIIWFRVLALLVMWVVCWWMYRRKIFLKI
ncbi:MAG: DUF5009 domain-containing protein [Opitutaceae bacterium]|nr:DUF5009 domain-containing protein [Opitutaceae bacterium]